MLIAANFVQKTREESELFFKTEMTYRQFESLSIKVSKVDLLKEISVLDYFSRISPAKNLNLSDVEKWLRNSWNTECVLQQNQNIISNTGQPFAMQWAFPQAYYAIFASLLAMYKALGFTQESHLKVIDYFGQLCEGNKLPNGISFYCKGSKKSYSYHNINKTEGFDSIAFDSGNPQTIDNQICQFLKSTRENNIEERAAITKFKTSTGQVRKKLNPTLWRQVSDSMGNTSLMDLLYRKRIKANYRDIDTFSAEQFKAEEVLNSLIVIVNRLNLVNESFIAKAIGIKRYNDMLVAYSTKINGSAALDRLNELNKMFID